MRRSARPAPPSPPGVRTAHTHTVSGPRGAWGWSWAGGDSGATRSGGAPAGGALGGAGAGGSGRASAARTRGLGGGAIDGGWCAGSASPSLRSGLWASGMRLVVDPGPRNAPLGSACAAVTARGEDRPHTHTVSGTGGAWGWRWAGGDSGATRSGGAPAWWAQVERNIPILFKDSSRGRMILGVSPKTLTRVLTKCTLDPYFSPFRRRGHAFGPAPTAALLTEGD